MYIFIELNNAYIENKDAVLYTPDLYISSGVNYQINAIILKNLSSEVAKSGNLAKAQENKNFSNPSGILKNPLNMQPRSISIFSHIYINIHINIHMFYLVCFKT